MKFVIRVLPVCVSMAFLCLITTDAAKDVRQALDILMPAPAVESDVPPPLLVFLHGRGSSPEAFAPLFTSMVKDGQYSVFLPCGSQEMESQSDGRPVYSWDPDKDGKSIIKKIKKIKGIDKDRIYLMGFSAGANMAYITAFENSKLFAGVIPFSGGLQENFLDAKKVERAPRGLRFYIVHGTHDRVMSVELGRRSLNWLQARGFRAKLVEFDGGHTIPADYLEIVEQAVAWFEE